MLLLYRLVFKLVIGLIEIIFCLFGKLLFDKVMDIL